MENSNLGKEPIGVWKYFTKNKTDSAVCCKCNKEIQCKGSSTSGLSRHLQSQHKIEIKRKVSDSDDGNNSTKKVRVQTLDKFAITISNRKRTLSEIVAKLASVDGFTINSIKNSSFIRESLISKNFELPKSNTAIMNLIYNYYEIARQQIIETIVNLKVQGSKFSITLDEWTSKQNKRYLNVNIHYLDNNFQNLGIIRIDGSCPAEKCLNLLKEKLSTFRLTFSDIVGSTTDGAAVMVKFGRISPFLHQLCYNHGIHLAVVDILYNNKNKNIETYTDIDSDSSIINYSDYSDSEDQYEILENDSEVNNQGEYNNMDENIYEALAMVRKIVKLFKKSPVRNTILQNHVKIECGKELNLLLDCVTRWNSIEPMLSRFFLVKKSIIKALKDLQLSHYMDEKNLPQLEMLLNTLKPIKLAVEALQRRESNLLTSEGILHFLFNSLKDQESVLANKMLKALQDRIMERRNKDLVSLIQFLQNPKQYNINSSNIIFEKTSKTSIIKFAKQIMDSLNYSSNDENERDETEATIEDVYGELDEEVVLINSESDLKRKLEKAVKESTVQMTISSKAKIENITTTSLKQEINIYEITGNITINLKNLLENLKTIRPTSTESERVFSIASNISTVKRSSLSDRSLDNLVFITIYNK